uniref:periodic tryptophan protein 2 homolog isoform X2 n=1 Tax=Myxine glutinosa TaxID=7769 RepID=UPI00358E2AAB
MKFAFRFSNLLGTAYRQGNLNFSPDGNSVLSPVGNRITLFDLKNNKSETLPVATRFNISCVGLSANGTLAVLVDEEGAAVLVSLLSKAVLHHFHFHKPVHSVSFSPDGRRFVVTKENIALMYSAPGRSREFNPFALEKTYYGPYDETTCIDWSDDSRCFAVGSKDMSTWVFGAERWLNLVYYSLGGHKDVIVGCFFESGLLDLYTVSRDGTLCVWECDTPPSGLIARLADTVGRKKAKKKLEIRGKSGKVKAKGKVNYARAAKYHFNKEGEFDSVTASTFHKQSHIMVSGFASGIFHIHELPDFTLIHSLSVSNQRISSISINATGDWIALGCPGYGQLLVWEWQSESYILKQQGHFNNMVTLSYSPDGQYVATGGDDGKVKVWNTTSGFCFVTFTEHTSSVTAVTFTSTGFVLLSASLDGSVRAFDLHRYRNFRTFTSPRMAQFGSLAVDPSGEVVCAGAKDCFDIFVWTLQTGRLLEVLAGHQGPVSSLCFSPSQALLVSASWDKTVKVWDVFEGKGNRETITLNSDALAVTFRPDGKEIAVATLDGQVAFCNVESTRQTGCIEGRHDLAVGRREVDQITAKQLTKGKAFTTLCYSADGETVLAGGHSKNVCIYNVKEQLLMKKFEISCNHSLDAMEEFLDRRNMSQFGSLARLTEGTEDGADAKLGLPGVRKGDMSSRKFKPEVCVTSLQFSPTGRAWAATSTEGLLIYSLDSNLIFDPFHLDMDITPSSVRRVLATHDFSTSLMMSFRLNEKRVIEEVMESIPASHIEVVAGVLPEIYVEKTLDFTATMLESSRHVHFFLLWAQHLLTLHGQQLKVRSASILPLIRNLQKNIQKQYDDLSKVCDWNTYGLMYALALCQQRGMKRTAEEEDGTGNHDDDCGDDDHVDTFADEDDNVVISELF